MAALACFSSESKRITVVMTCFEWSLSKGSRLFRDRQNKQRQTAAVCSAGENEKEKDINETKKLTLLLQLQTDRSRV